MLSLPSSVLWPPPTASRAPSDISGFPYSPSSLVRHRGHDWLSSVSPLTCPCVPPPLHRRGPGVPCPCCTFPPKFQPSPPGRGLGPLFPGSPSPYRRALIHDASSVVHFRCGPQVRLAPLSGNRPSPSWGQPSRCFVRLAPTWPVTQPRLVSGYLAEQGNYQDALLSSR